MAEVSNQRTRRPRSRAAAAVVAVGGGHLLGWALGVGWLLIGTDRQLGLTGETPPPGEVAGLLAGSVLVVLGVLTGAILAVRLSGRSRPVMRSVASLAGFVVGASVAVGVGVVVAGIVEVGTWQPPMLGAGVGTQLVILLPTTGPARATARITVPTLIDVLGWTGVGLLGTGWTASGLVAWFIAGMIAVAVMESVWPPETSQRRGAVPRQPPPEGDGEVKRRA